VEAGDLADQCNCYAKSLLNIRSRPEGNEWLLNQGRVVASQTGRQSCWREGVIHSLCKLVLFPPQSGFSSA
jgi:hypothetical protein